MKRKVKKLSRGSDLKRTVEAFELVARSKYASPLIKPILRCSIQDLKEGFNAYADRAQARIHRRLQAALRDFSRRGKSTARTEKT